MANIVLIGYRGCGKTTVGRLLADSLDRAFVDTDELVSHQAGCSIATIFERDGEAEFRRLEADAIRMATGRPNRIISVGGGAVESGENRKLLRKSGTVVWLEAPVDVLWRRIQADPKSATSRPNLAGGGIDEIQTILARRTPLYAETAHVVVRSGGRTPRQVMSDIEDWLAAQG